MLLARTSAAGEDLCQGLPAICWQTPWDGWNPGGSWKRKAVVVWWYHFDQRQYYVFLVGPIRVMIPAGKTEGSITIQPVSITSSFWLGCRGMWPWQSKALKCQLCIAWHPHSSWCSVSSICTPPNRSAVTTPQGQPVLSCRVS